MKKSSKIFILIDYRNGFYSSTKHRGAYMDFQKIKPLLEEKGFNVKIEYFSQVDFRSSKYIDSYILYQSSEDPGLKYKSYIEDIILGLKNMGAILIPKFEYFRAHHNKVFMEILRDISDLDEIKNLKTNKFGTIEEFLLEENRQELVKISAGSGGRDVFKFSNIKSLKKRIKTFTLFNLKMKVKSFLDKKNFTPISNYREKFITQNFINNLDGDYRVLVYGDRYYVLYRENRKNDFRASGGGNLFFVDEPNIKILNFAKKIKEYFESPIITLDIANNGKELFLIEFMFMPFGNYALEKSDHFFKEDNSMWIRINEKSNLEAVFINAIYSYINNL